MSRAPKPFCADGRAWLAARNGKGCLGFLTGGDARAFSAYLHLVDRWVCDRDAASVRALREVVAMLPSKGCHVEQLWSQIKPSTAPSYFADSRGVYLLGEDGLYRGKDATP